MLQIVMGDSCHANSLCGPVRRLLAFMDPHHKFRRTLPGSLGLHLLQKPAHLWNHGYYSDFPWRPIFQSCFRVSPNRDLFLLESAVTPSHICSLCLS